MTAVVRVLAPNPGPYTGPGTNTWLVVDDGEVVVIDPGPVIDDHLAAVLAAIGDATPVAVVVTHTHPDHAPLANPLGSRLGVPVLGHGPGPSFRPDHRLRDADEVVVGSRRLVAVHTPGHTTDHLCFRLDDVLFTGDHLIEGSTVVVEDAAAYLSSLYLVRDLGVRRLQPGHGRSIDDAGRAVQDYIDHRLMRERQLVAAIEAGAATLGELLDAVYAEVPAELRPAALHQVHVQLRKLHTEGWVRLGEGGPDPSTRVGAGARGSGPG